MQCPSCGYNLDREQIKYYYTMRGVQVQYANISVESVEYPNTTSSATMVDLSDAYRHGNTFSQVHVNYTNGFEVYVNKNASDWNVTCDGTTYTLPFAGWCGSNPSENFIGYHATINGQNITYINSSEFEITLKNYLGETNVTDKINGYTLFYNYNGTSKNHTFDTTYKVYDSARKEIISDSYPTGIIALTDNCGVRHYNMTDSTFYINMSGDYSSLEESGNQMDVFDDVEDIQGLTTGNDIVLRSGGKVTVTNFDTIANNLIFDGTEDQTFVMSVNVTLLLGD